MTQKLQATVPIYYDNRMYGRGSYLPYDAPQRDAWIRYGSVRLVNVPEEPAAPPPLSDEPVKTKNKKRP